MQIGYSRAGLAKPGKKNKKQGLKIQQDPLKIVQYMVLAFLLILVLITYFKK